MKKYFYLKTGQQVGPFSYDQLWEQKISPETMVWCEGMAKWQKAKTVHEFANWFPKQAAAQKRQPQQTQKRPQQNIPNRQPIQPRQNQVVKPKKSYRGIIGVAVFLVGIAIIYILVSQASTDSLKPTTTTAKSTSTKNKKSKQRDIQIQIPDTGDKQSFTVENYPLNPDRLGNTIAEFLGTVRTSSAQTKLLYLYPEAEDKFQYILDTYTETAIRIFFQGVVPSIKYQSPTSALVIFYNPWNDLVLITDWQLFNSDVFIQDLELVTADFLKYDGQNIGQLAPLWARNSAELPIEALTKQAEEREKLFSDIWGEMTGTGSWRQLLYSLSSLELLLTNQPLVAFRLRDQYLNLRYLTKGKEMKILRKPVLADMKKLHSPSHLKELIQKGPNTPKVVSDNMAIFPPKTWEKASVQTIRKVPEGAFVFVTTPRLTKTFLSFYYKFTPNEELQLNRIDWCTFDNEL